MSIRHIPAISMEQIEEYRKITGSSINEARVALRKTALAERLRVLRTEGTLEEKIDWLLDRFAETIC